MFRKLLCALSGHKVDLLRDEGGNVYRLVYTCDCGKEHVTRAAVVAVFEELAKTVA